MGGGSTVAGHPAPGVTLGGTPGEGDKGWLHFATKLTLSGTTTMEIGQAGTRGTDFDAITVQRARA
jgi:hypothetical protein